MSIVTFCAIIWGRVVTFLQYSRISTLSFLQVAFRSVSDSHLPEDHIHSHISTLIFTLYIFVLIYPCMLTPSCLIVRYIHLPARHLVFGAEKKNCDLFFCLHLNLRGTCCGRVCLQVLPSLGRALPPAMFSYISDTFLRAFQYSSDIFRYISLGKDLPPGKILISEGISETREVLHEFIELGRMILSRCPKGPD